MNMFQSVLEKVPKNRLEFVNDLQIPDVTWAPYIWDPAEVSLDTESISISEIDELEEQTVGSDSSLALSRAMTDSEIDYDRYRRLKSKRFSDPWMEMKEAMDAFPSTYLDSLNSFKEDSQSDSSEDTSVIVHNHDLHLRLQKLFEECRVFEPDDPGLLALEEALENLDIKGYDLDCNYS